VGGDVMSAVNKASARHWGQMRTLAFRREIGHANRMKTGSLLAFTALALLPLTVTAQTATDMVRVEVRVKNTTDRKDIKGSSADEKTENVTLDVSLSGKPKSPESRVVKWVIFGKDVADKDVKPLESGEEKLALSATGQQKFESKTASTTSTPEHAQQQSKGGGGKGGGSKGKMPTSKKVAGSGAKYVGWGVQVKDGATIVGEQYSGTTFKPLMK
jgi:hypothetical protein